MIYTAVVQSSCYFSRTLSMASLIKSEEYIYSLLEGETWIRLVEILPGKHEEVLRCRIHHVSQSKNPPYEALSYTWGELNLCCSALIEGKPLMINANLHSALKALRYDNLASRILWADAICINQKDMNESAMQVELMRDIYENALQVIVYLGEAADGSDELPPIFQLLNGLSKEVGSQGLVQSGVLQDLGFPLPTHRIWASFRALFSRPWWMRYWVIQEVILAQECVVLCGEWYWNWHNLVYVANRALLLGFPIIGDSRFYKSQATATAYLQAMLMYSLSMDHKSTTPWKLIDILSACRRGQATDERDYIYGVLGIASHKDRKMLKPNYLLTIEAIYLQCAQYFVTEGEGMMLLYNACLEPQAMALPSWVPNWSNKTTSIVKLAPIPGRLTRPFASAAEVTPSILLSLDRLGLKMLGMFVDDIWQTGILWTDTEQDQLVDKQLHLRNRALAVLEYANELETLLGASPLFPKDQSRKEITMRTMICNHLSEEDVQYMNPNITSLYDDLERISKGLRLVEQERWSTVIEYIPSAVMWGLIKKRAITKKGYAAQISHISEPRDKIFIPFGSDVPFVVRPKAGDYILIGECYVHGFMNGQALSMNDIHSQYITLI